jgi:hypothetical protein
MGVLLAFPKRTSRAYRTALLRCRIMMLILAFAALIPFAVSAQSTNEQNLIQHAAETVAALHDSMLDPASFVLDGVYVTKPHDIRQRKNGGWSKGPVIGSYVSVCYVYRSHNRMGGYGEGSFFEDGGDYKKNPLLTTVLDPSAKIPPYNGGVRTAMGAEDCDPKRIDRDISRAVADVAPALYRKSR